MKVVSRVVFASVAKVTEVCMHQGVASCVRVVCLHVIIAHSIQCHRCDVFVVVHWALSPARCF